jgi:hypothetical protein
VDSNQFALVYDALQRHCRFPNSDPFGLTLHVRRALACFIKLLEKSTETENHAESSSLLMENVQTQQPALVIRDKSLRLVTTTINCIPLGRADATMRGNVYTMLSFPSSNKHPELRMPKSKKPNGAICNRKQGTQNICNSCLLTQFTAFFIDPRAK